MKRRDLLIAAAAAVPAGMTFIPGSSAEALEKDFPEFTVAFTPEHRASFATLLHTWVVEQELDGKHDDIVMPRDAYVYLRINNQIDHLEINDGKKAFNSAPHFAGHRVRVPGSSLA